VRRQDLLRYLERHGCLFLREGSRHTVYFNPANRKATAIPRHSEIAEPLARKIARDLDLPPP